MLAQLLSAVPAQTRSSLLGMILWYLKPMINQVGDASSAHRPARLRARKTE